MTVEDVGRTAPFAGSDAAPAILLVAHGSARYPDAGRPAAAQAARLRQACPGRRIGVGLLHGAPSVAEALAGLDAPAIRAVPFFMEHGWFTRVAVPRAVGGDPRVVLCPPVGVHGGIAGLVTAMVRQRCAGLGLDPGRTAVLLVGHGSARAPGRALAVHRHAQAIAATAGFATVGVAHLEEPPLLPDGLAALRHYPVAVVGFFAGEGGHVRDDLPAALRTEQAARGHTAPPVHNFGSVADNPGVTQIILEQAGIA